MDEVIVAVPGARDHPRGGVAPSTELVDVFGEVIDPLLQKRDHIAA